MFEVFLPLNRAQDVGVIFHIDETLQSVPLGEAFSGPFAMFAKTPMSERQFCAKCGGHLMANHPPLGMVDVFAATLPTLKFTPSVHVNYAETVLPMRDGLPKLKDFPAEFGGSGEALPE